MGFLASLHDEQRAHEIAPLTLQSKELAKYFSGGPVSSGVSVSEDTALNYAAVWSAVSLISSDVASLPLILYQRLSEGGKTRYTGSKLYKLLKDEPNPEMGAMIFRETLTAHVLLWGNGYAEIVRDGADRPTALWPLTPDRVVPYREAGRIRYRISGVDGRAVDLDARNVLHVPGLGWDGLCGYSVVTKARESIGLGIATEKFGGTFFGNGATFGKVFEHPGKLSEQAKKNFIETIEARHQGVSRAHKIMVVEEGMKLAPNSGGVNPHDAEFLAQRKFQIEEIARWFRLPPHKIGAMDRATFSNIEHQGLDYYTSCLRSWLVRWEQEINRKLIPQAERNIQFAEHLTDAVLRSDIKTRYDAYAVARNWGWMSADDVLEKENMNPLPNGQGKIYLFPQNMWPADKIDDMIKAQNAKAKPPSAKPPEPGEGRARITLEPQWVTLLRAQPETGMGYQRVDVRFTDGRALANCLVFNGDQLDVPAEFAATAIDDVRLHTDPTARALELLEQRLTRADQTVAATEFMLRAREQTCAELAQRIDSTEAERDEARSAVKAWELNLSQITVLKLAIEAERDTLRQQFDAEAEAKQIAETAALEARQRAKLAEQGRIAAEVLEQTQAALAKEATTRSEEQAKIARDAEAVAATERASRAAADGAKADAERQLLEARQRAEQADAERARLDGEAQAATEREIAARADAVRLAGDLEAATALLAEATASRETEASARQEAERMATEARDQATQALRTAEAATHSAQETRTAAEQAERAQVEAIAALDASQTRVADLEKAQRQWIETDTHRAAGWEQDRARATTAEQRAVELEARQRAEADARATAEAERDAKAAEVEAVKQVEADRVRAMQAERDAATTAASVAQADAAAREAARQTDEAARLHAETERDANAAEVEQIRRATVDQKTRMIGAHRGLFVDAFGRMVRREISKARRAQATPQKLRNWVEQFYTESEAAIFVDALVPAFRAHLAWRNDSDDPMVLAVVVVKAHFAESIAVLRAVADSDPDEFATTLELRLQQWESYRADVAADRILEEEVAYVRSLR